MLPKKPTVHESQETSSVSISEEASAVLKKAGLAEAAAKASREKANQMEDVRKQKHFTARLGDCTFPFLHRLFDKCKLNCQFYASNTETM